MPTVGFGITTRTKILRLFHANPDVSANVHVRILVLPEIKANEMGYFPLQPMQLAIKPP